MIWSGREWSGPVGQGLAGMAGLGLRWRDEARMDMVGRGSAGQGRLGAIWWVLVGKDEEWAGLTRSGRRGGVRLGSAGRGMAGLESRAVVSHGTEGIGLV